MQRQQEYYEEEKKELVRMKERVEGELKEIKLALAKGNKSQELRALQQLDLETKELTSKVNQLKRVNVLITENTPLRSWFWLLFLHPWIIWLLNHYNFSFDSATDNDPPTERGQRLHVQPAAKHHQLSSPNRPYAERLLDLHFGISHAMETNPYWRKHPGDHHQSFRGKIKTHLQGVHGCCCQRSPEREWKVVHWHNDTCIIRSAKGDPQ